MTVYSHQLIMVAALNNASLMQYAYLIGILDG